MLVTENLSYAIKGYTLLRDVSFVLQKGEVLAVLGANGAGKSTLIRLLSGEKTPVSGCIRLDNQLLQDYHPGVLARRRATMSQQQVMTADFEVGEVVMMGRYPHFNGRPSGNDQLAVDEAMDVCGVARLARRTILSLSGGEQQRVHLARVLAQIWDQPGALLLMDEPVSAMDVQFQHQTLAIARALANRGMMVIMILHDMNLAAQYADRLLLLKNGRKLHDGSPAEVLNERNIYTVFSIDAEVKINPANLKTTILPAEMELDAGKFNSILVTGD